MQAAPRITKIDLWHVNVPLLHEWIGDEPFGGSHPHGHDRTIVRITDTDSFQGWGELAAAPPMSSIEQAAKCLLGQPINTLRPALLPLTDPNDSYWLKPAPPSPYTPPIHSMAHRVRHTTQVMFETALCDLIAKRAALPMSHLFGGPCRDRVLTDYWVGRMTPDHLRRCAQRGLDLGFHGLKLKTTLEDPNIERLEAIKDQVGPNFKVTVDPNGRFYRLDDAWPTIAQMDRVGNMAILEDPFPRYHLEQFAALRPRINARVVLHLDPPESLWAVLRSEAAGGINISSHAQGLFNWRSQAAVVQQANLSVWHGSGLDLGIYTAAQLQLSAATPNCTLPGDQIGPWLRESTLLKTKFEVVDGHIIVPQGPGLGVEIDPNAIDKYTTANQTLIQ